MEFEHVGLHCEAPGCGQKDFLPFHCDCCNKKYCLEHRSYTAHNCAAAGIKDIHSVECPICHKSIKFDMSKDVNQEWETHYASGCQPAAVAVKKTCAKKSCHTVIGPSNGYKCLKCSQVVCLSHRNPEDHECRVIPTKSTWLDRVEQSTTKPKAVPAKKPTASSAVKSVDSSNTLKGTAARRMQGNTDTPTASKPPSTTVFALPSAAKTNNAPVVCPFCDYIDSSANAEAELLSHIAINHPDPSSSSGVSAPPPAAARSTTATNKSSQVNPALGREVCPVCSARFMDATDLVIHFESAHPSGPPAGATTTSNTSDNANCQLS